MSSIACEIPGIPSDSSTTIGNFYTAYSRDEKTLEPWSCGMWGTWDFRNSFKTRAEKKGGTEFLNCLRSNRCWSCILIGLLRGREKSTTLFCNYPKMQQMWYCHKSKTYAQPRNLDCGAAVVRKRFTRTASISMSTAPTSTVCRPTGAYSGPASPHPAFVMRSAK